MRKHVVMNSLGPCLFLKDVKCERPEKNSTAAAGEASMQQSDLVGAVEEEPHGFRLPPISSLHNDFTILVTPT